MSTISTTSKPSNAQAIIAAANARNTPKVVEANKVGFAGLTSETFLKLLVAQLQNQDPTQPTSNEEIVSQLSQMQSLQANLDLQDSLKNITLSQQVASSSGFIGKSITGVDGQKKPVTGVVEKVLLRDGKAYLGVGTKEVLMSDVSQVRNAS